jgi:DNA-binding transcriptional MerR regulator
MRQLKTTEAAALLEVASNTLRAWERRFGFPEPERSPGGHRFYSHGEVAALRAALREGLSISSAISHARAALAADTESLVAALLGYDHERADRALETTLALRSVERSVEEVLLPGLETIAGRMGAESAAWAFAARWAGDWLRRAKRFAPPAVTTMSILVGDGSRDELDLDAPHIRALELFCLRAGVKVVSLSARAINGLGDVASVHGTSVVVLAGRHVADDTAARWAYLVRRSVGPIPVAFYRAATPRTLNTVLPPEAGEAWRHVLDLADASSPSPVRNFAAAASTVAAGRAIART